MKLKPEDGVKVEISGEPHQRYRLTPPPKVPVYIAGYPKSGTTWLTRLLADILYSPSGGCMSKEDHKEIAAEGAERPGPYIVRKGHYVLIDNDTGPVVPRPHRLAYKPLEDRRVIFLVRDPRDIAVSGAHHWRTTPALFLERMIRGNVARCGRWDSYVKSWLDIHIDNFAWTSYEQLSQQRPALIEKLLRDLDLKFNLSRIETAIERQSFTNRKKQIAQGQEVNRGTSYNIWFMRKGIAGDWKNHFSGAMNNRAWGEFGEVMERLGYER